jgi:ATP-dependent helicase Lhr and Lhr-like helicase
LAASCGLSEDTVTQALLALENEGFVFRGDYIPNQTPFLQERSDKAISPSASPSESWCERRLLHRIHRYTLDTLRESIQPVPVQDFMRFLFDLHQMDSNEDRTGPEILQQVLEQLEGFEAPASAWETNLIPSRIAEYDPAWLDALCLSGKIVWGRFNSPKAGVENGKRGGPVKNTPISLVLRGHLELWRQLAASEDPEVELSSHARAIREHLKSHGASFFDDFVFHTRLLPSQIEGGIAELVSLGLAASDSYAGLRALLTPQANRPPTAGLRRHSRASGKALYGIEHAGRWALVPHFPKIEKEKMEFESLEETALIYLKRWGVLFRSLIEKESFAPPWRILVRVLRRMELRGDLRGGRFVSQVSGEQFALPETVETLRKIRSKPKTGKLISISASDPLNLLGTILPGKKLAKLNTNRIVFQDGLPLAVLEGKKIQHLKEPETGKAWQVQEALVRSKFPPKLRYYLGKNYI